MKHQWRQLGHADQAVCTVCKKQDYEVSLMDGPCDGPAVWDLVLADMAARDKLGEARYGTRLQPHNGRDVLQDAYEEALDLAVYLRQAIYERDGR